VIFDLLENWGVLAARRTIMVLLAAAFMQSARAKDSAVLTVTNSSLTANAPGGILNWLDRRSAYYQDAFPQPLLVDDTGLEEGELEFGSLHTQAGQQQSDEVTVGVQKSFGLLTLELGVPYEREADSDDVSQGIGSIELGGRYPLCQFVSASGFFDTTMGVALEIGIPVNSVEGGSTEVVPKLFNDLKLGGHFTIQTVLGYSTFLGDGQNGGLQTFEYGFALGYAIPHDELPLPWEKQFTPLLELDGEMIMNQSDAGQNSLPGSIGFRMDLKPIGDIDPSFAVGFVFPMDTSTREEIHWGIATGLTLEF